MLNRRIFIKHSGIALASSLLTLTSLFSEESNKEINKILKTIKKQKLHLKSIGDRVAGIAELFLGLPYIGGTLDQQTQENLVFRLDGFDCVTFCETALSFARISDSTHLSKNGFENELTKIRYKNGIINGYESRSHYSSEWIANNCKLGILKDMSQELNGMKFTTSVFFMSQNPNYYKALKDNPALVAKISKNEDIVNSIDRYYIPVDAIPSIIPLIQHGDIILIATSKPGLDYSHLGIAYRRSGSLHFMHASSKAKKVIIDIELIEYLSNSKSAVGISVLRPL